MEQSILTKVSYNRVSNVSLIAKVLGWVELRLSLSLSAGMNILLVLITTGRVHYCPHVGYHNKDAPHTQSETLGGAIYSDGGC